jgi:hypothetical protein
MPPPNTFTTQLSLTSYLSPDPDPQWAILRAGVVAQALAMGCEESTMTERGIQWFEDQDPFGHVSNASFGLFVNAHGIRVLDSFEAQLGKDKTRMLMRGKGVGMMMSEASLRFLWPVTYPDSVGYLSSRGCVGWI